MDATATDDSPSSTRPARLNVLVVEDDDDDRDLMASAVSHMDDCRVALAATGKAGLRHLRPEVYDVVVTDIGLPDISGIEMLDRAMAEGRLSGREVIIIVSGNVRLSPHVLARGWRFLPKPVDVERLQYALRSARTALVGRRTRPRVFEHRISGYDFVRALLLGGYRITRTTGGYAVLVKDATELWVPQKDALDDDVILALLERADLLPSRFVTLSHRLGSRDTSLDPGESFDSATGPRTRGPGRAAS
jgi:CheY-like chemotaxis protein